MADKKKNPSFPSNYVTLAQLQERWLKEREGKEKHEQQQQQQQPQREEDQKQKQKLEDRKSEAEKVEPGDSESPSWSRRRRRSRENRGARVKKEDGVSGGDGADQEGIGKEKKTAKKNKKKKTWKDKKRSLTAEKEVAGEGVLAEAPLASGDQASRAEARAENEVSNVEPDSRVLSVNGGIVKGSGQFRSGGRSYWVGKRTGGKARPQNSDLDQTADTEPKLGALSENGGLGGNVEKKKRGSRTIKGETRAESSNLDQTVYIEPKFKALSVNGLTEKGNGGLKRNGDIRDRESGGTKGETRAESKALDPTAHVEPSFRAVSVNGRIEKGNDGMRRRGAYQNHRHREFRGFGRQEAWNAKEKDSGMIWVKKGEVSDGNGVGT